LPPVEQPAIDKYGLLGVALTVVPDTDTVEPLPLGQAAGVGKVITCALVQSSLAGWAKTTL